MRKVLFILTVLCLSSVAAFAQKGGYAGTWTLDASKSKLDERMRIESMTLTVAQTESELKVTTATKRAAPPADAQRPPGGGGGGGGRGGGFGGGDGTTVYDLTGKETKSEIETQMGKIPQTFKAKSEGGKLHLSRTVSTQMGDMTTKETWSLSEDGKTLTIEREQATPRGTNASTMVFVKG
ncbi:MAG: hypothetical protein AB7Q37_02355 [Pyrinomonadaceae bacterium]